MKRNKCFVKKSFFGNDIYKHEWGYFDTQNKKCIKCGREEILIDICNGSEFWELKIKSK